MARSAPEHTRRVAETNAFALEGLEDPAPQLGLRGKAMRGVDLDREPEAQVGLAEADDALDFGRLERPAALRGPLGPDAIERGERVVDVGVVADAHVQHRPAPALAVVDER